MTDALSDEAVLDELKQWYISSPAKPRQLLPKSTFEGPADRSYNLKDSKVRKFLQHEEQTYGINLGWTDDAEPETAKKVARWFFSRSAEGDRPLRYGETIAIGNGKKPSFIRYKERTVGINLDWSNTPVYEWKLAGGELGQPIDPRKYLAIYNQKGGEFLIFFDRTRGGDIGWPSSQTWGAQLTDELLEQAKEKGVELLLKAAASG
jgi:hypothetical protein